VEAYEIPRVRVHAWTHTGYEWGKRDIFILNE